MCKQRKISEKWSIGVEIKNNRAKHKKNFNENNTKPEDSWFVARSVVVIVREGGNV